MIARMGGLTESQIARAIEALVARNPDLAEAVVAGDERVDDLNYEIDEKATVLIALRQPMALDLRNIIAALKIAADLERIADYAANIARRSLALSEVAPVRPMHAIPRMSLLVQQMIKEVLDAYVERNVDKAMDGVGLRPRGRRHVYEPVPRAADLHDGGSQRSITPCTHLLFIAKHIERIGDHVTNIAEIIHYLVEGTRMRRLAAARQHRRSRDRRRCASRPASEPPALRTERDETGHPAGR